MSRYVDGKKMFEVPTHFMSDWTTRTGDNVPECGNGKPFTERSMLVLSLSVGGYMFPETKYGKLSLEEAETWEKPTFEVDWVRVYDPNAEESKEKLTVFNIPGIDGLDLTY